MSRQHLSDSTTTSGPDSSATLAYDEIAIIADTQIRNFFHAIKNNNLNCVREMIRNYPELVNCRTLNEAYRNNEVMKEGDQRYIKLMKDRGKKAIIVNKGTPALCYALTECQHYPEIYSNASMVGLLIQHGANIIDLLTDERAIAFLNRTNPKYLERIENHFLQGLRAKQHNDQNWQQDQAIAEMFLEFTQYLKEYSKIYDDIVTPLYVATKLNKKHLIDKIFEELAKNDLTAHSTPEDESPVITPSSVSQHCPKRSSRRCIVS